MKVTKLLNVFGHAYFENVGIATLFNCNVGFPVCNVLRRYLGNNIMMGGVCAAATAEINRFPHAISLFGSCPHKMHNVVRKQFRI